MSPAFKPVRHRYEDALSRLSWHDFHERIAGYFANAGYDVESTEAGAHADRGADLVLRRGDETLIATCRHWTAFQVPHADVHRLIGQMPGAGATGAIMITSGEFTRQAVDAAARFRHVRLVDGRALRALLGPIEDVASRSFLPLHTASAWAPVSTPVGQAHGPAPSRSAGRAAAIAAVAAVLVMAIAMLTLYTWYIRDIHATRRAPAGQMGEVYRHAGAVPAPPPFAQPEPAHGTGAQR